MWLYIWSLCSISSYGVLLTLFTQTIWVCTAGFFLIASYCLLLFPSLIKLRHTGGHVREWHKNKEPIQPCREPLSPRQKQQTLPELELIAFSQRGREAYTCHPPLPTISLPCNRFQLKSPYFSLTESSACDSTCSSYCISLLQKVYCLILPIKTYSLQGWLSTGDTLKWQWLTTVQMWGRIRKLGDRCSELIAQLQTELRPVTTPKH